jgi:hypothetical protein
MAEKIKCSDIWDFWGKGWICIPTAPDNESDRFPSEIGRFLVSRFPGLEKNYNRLCDSNIKDVSIFRSTETRTEPKKKILMYSDLRVPLSPGDYGVILTPDISGKVGSKDENEIAEWECIERTVSYLKDNLHMIPGTIFMPPLGFRSESEGLTEEDAIDELMALLIEVDRIKIIHGLKTEIKKEETSEDTKNEKEEKPNLPIDEEDYPNEESHNGSLIEDDYDVIEVVLPNK